MRYTPAGLRGLEGALYERDILGTFGELSAQFLSHGCIYGERERLRLRLRFTGSGFGGAGGIYRLVPRRSSFKVNFLL